MVFERTDCLSPSPNLETGSQTGPQATRGVAAMRWKTSDGRECKADSLNLKDSVWERTPPIEGTSVGNGILVGAVVSYVTDHSAPNADYLGGLGFIFYDKLAAVSNKITWSSEEVNANNQAKRYDYREQVMMLVVSVAFEYD